MPRLQVVHLPGTEADGRYLIVVDQIGTDDEKHIGKAIDKSLKLLPGCAAVVVYPGTMDAVQVSPEST